MNLASDWNDYQILDMANGEKLEKWNNITLVRPDPQIIWKQKNNIFWKRRICPSISRSKISSENWYRKYGRWTV